MIPGPDRARPIGVGANGNPSDQTQKQREAPMAEVTIYHNQN